MKTSNAKKIKKASPAKKAPAKRGRPAKVVKKAKPVKAAKPVAKKIVAKKLDKFAVVANKIDLLMAQVADLHRRLVEPSDINA